MQRRRIRLDKPVPLYTTIISLIALPIWALLSSIIISLWAILLTIMHLPGKAMGPHSFWNKHKFYNRSSK